MRSRVESLAAMLVIGDGVFAAATPKRHLRRWEAGPGWWRGFVRPLRERPALARALGVAEVAAGIAWARRLPLGR